MNFPAIGAAFRFEWQRGLTLSRHASWLVLIMFPPLLMLLLRMQRASVPTEAIGMVLFLLCPGAVCLLSLLLWVSPAVNSELEGRAWSYLTIRPGGRTAVMLGKYAAGVLRAIITSVSSLTLAVIAIFPIASAHLWLVLTILSVLAAISFGALYMLIGIVFHRRAMVVAVGYSLFVELMVGFVPAVINKFTLQYRLRSLLTNWMGWEFLQGNMYFSDTPSAAHVIILLLGTATLLVAAAVAVTRIEFVTADES